LNESLSPTPQYSSQGAKQGDDSAPQCSIELIGFQPTRLPFIQEPSEIQAQLLSTLTNWEEENRLSEKYAVLPAEYRDQLWSQTEPWIPYIFKSLAYLRPPDDIYLLAEFAKRIDNALIPFFKEWILELESVIQKYNPFPEILDDQGEISLKMSEYSDDTLDRIRNSWFTIYRMLVRTAREDGKYESYSKGITLLEKISQQNIEWRHYYFHEKALYHLSNLQEKELRILIEAWSINIEDFPIFALRKSAILFELGEDFDASQLIRSVIEQVRINQKENPKEISNYSIENIAQFIISYFLIRHPSDDEKGKNSERLRFLNSCKGNPKDEIESIAQLLRCEAPDPKPQREEKIGFDPGHKTISYHAYYSDDFSEEIRAYSLPRLLEKSGIPIYIGNNSPNIRNGPTISIALTNAAARVEKISKPWSLSYFLRIGLCPDLEKAFSRINVAILPDD